MKLHILCGAALLAAFAAMPQPAAACGFGDEECPVILAASQKPGAPLSLAPSAHDRKKSVKKSRRSKAAQRRQVEEAPQAGVPSGAFATAAHFIITPPRYSDAQAVTTMTIVRENELSEIDLLAGKVRVVDAGDASEIDLSRDSATAGEQAMAQADPEKDGDDDIFNRVLMTFAGALAAASAMRIFIA